MKKVQWEDEDEKVETSLIRGQIASLRGAKVQDRKIITSKVPKKAKVHDKSDCDKLLSHIIKKLYPNCLLCGNLTQVAHHHCHKSKSLNLRYDIQNLIPLCNPCHLKLHWDESYWGSKVASIRGKEWFDYIEKNKSIIVKDKDYEAEYQRLKNLLN